MIYPTLVGMAQQSWKMRVPLVDPQGNFGSIDPDPPAAMRYTEARMTHAAVDMLQDLNLDTVDFQPNYDERLMEPTGAPGPVPESARQRRHRHRRGHGDEPAATQPHGGLRRHRPHDREPEIAVHELMQDVARHGRTDASGVVVRGIKGPDFPTGGVVHGKRGIVEAYAIRGAARSRCAAPATSRTCRARTASRSSSTQIPYMLGQNTLVESIVDAVKEDRIADVSDVRNESGREAQTRIVIELKRGGPAVVEKQLYEFTPLQQTFSIMNIALVNRQPRTLSLPEMIGIYIDHRIDVTRRRTTYLLREAKKRAHVLEGMIYAVCDIDEVIREIRAARRATRPSSGLMAGSISHQDGAPAREAAHARCLDRIRTAEKAAGVHDPRSRACRPRPSAACG